MPTITASIGLCVVCKYDHDCTYQADSHGVILQCAQFEMALRNGVRPSTPLRAAAVSGRFEETNGYAGLCSNCGHRKTCTYPKPEGGIWRCEEYV